LLVDDENVVLNVTKTMLQALGHRVFYATSGRGGGCPVYYEKKDEINLLIMDMIMPGISGNETFDRIRQINPNRKILLSSGYSVDGKAQEILDKGCNGFQKPFGLEQLAHEIRSIIET